MLLSQYDVLLSTCVKSLSNFIVPPSPRLAPDTTLPFISFIVKRYVFIVIWYYCGSINVYCFALLSIQIWYTLCLPFISYTVLVYFVSAIYFLYRFSIVSAKNFLYFFSVFSSIYFLYLFSVLSTIYFLYLFSILSTIYFLYLFSILSTIALSRFSLLKYTKTVYFIALAC